MSERSGAGLILEDLSDVAFFLGVRMPIGLICFPAYLSERLHDASHPKAAKIAAGITGLMDGGTIGLAIAIGQSPTEVLKEAFVVAAITGLLSVAGALEIENRIKEYPLKLRPKMRLNLPFKNFLRIYD